jgi:hypothetical protein
VTGATFEHSPGPIVTHRLDDRQGRPVAEEVAGLHRRGGLRDRRGQRVRSGGLWVRAGELKPDQNSHEHDGDSGE